MKRHRHSRHGSKQSTMDRFLVRSPKVSPASSPTKKTGEMRQATLESLKGVVVLEDMERAKVVLERSDVSTELKVDTLQHLLSKTPAKEVLIRTKLGKTVHKLCRDKDAEVAAVAQQVYAAWKKHILSKENRPFIEVKTDLKTQRLRNSARQMLHEALQREIEEAGDSKSSRGQAEEVEEDCKNSPVSERESERRETGQNAHKYKKKREKEKCEGNSEEKSSQKRQKDKDKEKHVKFGQNHEEEEMKEKSQNTKSHQRRKEDEEKYTKTKQNMDGGKMKSKIGEKRKKEGNDKEEEEESENTRPQKKRKEENVSDKHESAEMLAEHLEQKVYHNSQRRVDLSYRRTIRSLVFTLRHQKDVRTSVVSASLSVEDFINQYRKS